MFIRFGKDKAKGSFCAPGLRDNLSNTFYHWTIVYNNKNNWFTFNKKLQFKDIVIKKIHQGKIVYSLENVKNYYLDFIKFLIENFGKEMKKLKN